MPPILAALLTHCFIAWLFWRDLRQRTNVTRALWIPVIWMLIISTRFVSAWLGFLGLPLGSANVEEGSPVDAVVYFGLITAGLYILNQRRVQLATIIRSNKWLALFFLYCFLAIFWSDFPFISFKRWIKVLGHPIMVLLLLSEPDREEALTRLMKRVAYIVVPISVLFIKYYPQHGRAFDPWSGAAVNTGITTNKNSLGLICMILGYFLLWHLQRIWRASRGWKHWEERAVTGGLLVMIGWLLYMARSSTSLVSLVTGSLVMGILGLRVINPRYVGTYFLLGIAALVIAETGFDMSGRIIELLGKDPTLTDRTMVWEEVLKVEFNPVLGAGFEAFWLGERSRGLWEIYWWKPNQAHNGYIETYINLGAIGLSLLIGLLLVTFWKCRTELLRNPPFGRLGMGFLVAVILFNWTEATFKAVHPVLFVFYMIAIDLPRPRPVRKRAGSEPVRLPTGSTPSPRDVFEPAGGLGRPDSRNGFSPPDRAQCCPV